MENRGYREKLLVALDKFIHYFGGVKLYKETTTDDARKILKDYYKEKKK